jgi:hypothetical protein
MDIRCLFDEASKGGSWSSPARGGARLGVVCERSRRAGRRHVSPRCRVGHAWTFGLVRRQVALRVVAPVSVWSLGLLLYGELVDYRIAPDNAYSQGVQELNASAGAW